MSNIKSKSCLTKQSNGSATNFTSKPKKSKPLNSNRNESTSQQSLSGAPKKPINPYLLFCQENRSSIQEKYQQKYNVLLILIINLIKTFIDNMINCNKK